MLTALLSIPPRQVNLTALDLRRLLGAKTAADLVALPSRCSAAAPETFRVGAPEGRQLTNTARDALLTAVAFLCASATQ